MEPRVTMKRQESGLSEASNHYLVEVEQLPEIDSLLRGDIEQKFRRSPLNSYIFPRMREQPRPQLRSIDFSSSPPREFTSLSATRRTAHSGLVRTK